MPPDPPKAPFSTPEGANIMQPPASNLIESTDHQFKDVYRFEAIIYIIYNI